MAGPPPAPNPRLPFPLQEGERVIQLCRRHWWHLWPKTIIWLLFAVAPVIAAVWLLYWVVRLLLNWYRYHNDIWVVTDQRIIDSFKPTPFQLRVGTADLVNIQDMSIEKSGIIPTVLNFGDVVCQTAGTGQQFRIGGVPHPEQVQLLVDKERDRERMRHA